VTQPGGERWVEVSPSQFTHEAEGLALVRALLPDETPFRAWSNFEFRDSRGKWHEVDLLVLGRGRLHLVELKYYSGTLRGDDHTWIRDGHRAEQSPLKLARRKAQYLASKLTTALDEWAKAKHTKVQDPRLIVPFIQESVFLHHPGFRCELPASSALGLYGLDGHDPESHLSGISALLLEEPQKTAIGPNQEAILSDLLAKIGLVQRRERSAGSWTITDQALADGDGWQEWLAHHSVAQHEQARIRFQVTPAGAPASESQRVRKIAEHEYSVMSRLHHDGILRPKDLVQSELGVGLAYDYHESWQPLDLWLAEQTLGAPLVTRLSILRQVGEAVQYAHANKVVHRALAPRAVWVRSVGGTKGDVKVRVGGWEGSGIIDVAGATHTALPGITALQGAADPADPEAEDQGFKAPEGQWSPTADRVRIDVFGLGAIAFYIFAGAPAATSRNELAQRLRAQDGLDLAVEHPAISSQLRDLVLRATRPAPTKRTGDVSTFLSLLDAAERAANTPEESSTDPLEATPGALLSSRFELIRRLGQGSTAVGLLVKDLQAANSPNRVLKVALHDDAGKRLSDEAEVLRALDSPRIVKLIEGPLSVNGRQALLLESAGEQTLTHEIQARTRLSLDLLERYGNDLLDAVITLDKAGIDHRDIKPSNLGVREGRGDRAKHLVLFDFSLTRAAASATNAGTPPYLDPFLVGKRNSFDSAAERYATAVVLFEMATGQAPRYGDDPDAAPAAIPDGPAVRSDLFDPTLAPRLVAFFSTALAREVSSRHHTAESMRRAWRDIFATEATTEPDESADTQAAEATLATPLARSGLTARALSALEPERIATVGELLATDPVRINHLRGVADATRKQINRRIKEWRQRLGDVAAPKHPTDRAAAANTLEAAATTLLAPLATERTKSRAALLRLVLGLGTDLDAFATQAQLGAHLPEPVNAARAGQILTELQQTWAADTAAVALLTGMVEHFQAVMVHAGYVLTPAEAAAHMAAHFSPTSDETDMGAADLRRAAGLVRITLERIRELRRADEEAAEPIVVRRRQGQVTLIGQDQTLLDVAEWVAARAEELVSQAGDPTTAIVPARRAAVELWRVFDAIPIAQVPIAMREFGRLADLAGAVSPTSATAASGDLHHRDLSLVTALRLTFGDVASIESLSAKEIRDRVHVRFPALVLLPNRPQLDALIDEAGLQLQFDDRKQAYRTTTRIGDTTGLASRQPTIHAASLPGGATNDSTRRVEESLRTRAFLALGVPADRLDRFHHGVEGVYAAQLVDVTGVLLDELRSQAERLGVPWGAVRAADAAAATSRERQGLRELVRHSWGAVSAALENAISADRPGPVVLTEAGPLARYDNMPLLARWTDLGTSRGRAVWLVVPQLAANRGSLLDGHPVPLATPTQFVNLDAEWVDALAARSTTSTDVQHAAH